MLTNFSLHILNFVITIFLINYKEIMVVVIMVIRVVANVGVNLVGLNK